MKKYGGTMIAVNHWPINQVLLVGASKGPVMFSLAKPGVQILMGPMKNSQ